LESDSISIDQPSVILIPEISQWMEHIYVMVLSEEHHKNMMPSF